MSMDKKFEDIRSQLHEREKELDALYKLSELFTEPGLLSEEIIKKTAEILKESMQFDEYADVQIILSESDDGCPSPEIDSKAIPEDNTCTAAEAFSINKLLTITITYSRERLPNNEKMVFLEREKDLVQSTAELLANVLQKNELETILRRSTAMLQQQTEDLEHKNIALQEILSNYDAEKRRYQAEIRSFFDSIIYPEINKLLMNDTLHDHSRDMVLNIKTSLEKRFDRDSDSLLKIRNLLTPRELEICSLIKNGMSTKDISSHLNISELTVERHRNTIRKKLNLNNSCVNLTTYLRS